MNPDFMASRNRLERIVMQCWGEVLGRPEICPDDNFFDLGGDSILAIKLQRLLQRRLGLDVSILWLFRHPSVRGFVESVADARGALSGPTVPRLSLARVRPSAPAALTPTDRAARQREALESRRGAYGRP